MRGFLINKNLCFYYWLKKRIGKDNAFKLVNKIEKVILIFGRKAIPAAINGVKGECTVNSEMNDDLSLIREEE
jgi:hypothetical protein